MRDLTSGTWRATVRSVAGECGHAAMDALLPAICLHCGDILRLRVGESGALCASCRRRLADCRLVEGAFPLFGDAEVAPASPLAAMGPSPLPDLAWRMRTARVVGLYAYPSGSPVRTLHRALKFEGRVDVGEWIGRHMARRGLEWRRVGRGSTPRGGASGAAVQRTPPPRPPAIIVPIPSHPLRTQDRGYNHAAILARAVASELRLPVDESMLCRFRLGPSQSSVRRSNRDVNVAGVFRVDKASRLTGLRVWLVDDVYTTGATLRSAAGVLLHAGAESLTALTMAVRRIR